MPENNKRVLVTILQKGDDGDPDSYFVEAATYFSKKFIGSEMNDLELFDEVIAWMPCIEPYKEEGGRMSNEEAIKVLKEQLSYSDDVIPARLKEAYEVAINSICHISNIEQVLETNALSKYLTLVEFCRDICKKIIEVMSEVEKV